jgi:hypothetical protein
LLDGDEDAEHSGFHTLMRILDERLIRASAKLTRGSSHLVSFTECLPAELRKLILWRKGLIRWTFEPYGVAIAKDCLVELGAKHVIYGDEKRYADLSEQEQFLFQLQMDSGTDWSVEKEWRISGNVRLDKIPPGDILVIVSSLQEARTVASRTGYNVTLVEPPERWSSKRPVD